MKKINEYLDFVFKDFPKTKRNNELRNNILDAMESRYLDLIDDGMDNDTALQNVIGQFGNIDELKLEYEVAIDNNIEYIQSNDAEEYFKFKKKFSTLIGFGVALIILAVGLVALFSETKFENLMAFILMMVITIAVAIFVFMGLENNKYTDINTGSYHLLESDSLKYNKTFKDFTSSFNLAITIAVVLCIFAGSLAILTEEILNLGDRAFSGIFFPLVALAVFIFVKFGIMFSTYQSLINPQKAKESLEKEAQKNFGWINGVTMPLAAMVFLVIGFIYEAWHPGWIIFPITAIVTNGLIIILNKTSKSSN